MLVINDSAESSFNFFGRDSDFAVSDELRYSNKVNKNWKNHK